ncbi:telomere zinc finger-associated protein-like [Paramacrobiotus metropolitanus]|uniref:telomere zinc finger-associated protein-like n=1 Tax=Paramacrobiotus metropolitanus TaxID=2943436 RepID=UPI0024463AF5|nr:telomere zinc finger-associated protein-like [Paramacrobiotus metropolitanus]
MELDCCLPGSDSELLIPRHDPPLQDIRNLLNSAEGSHGSGIRHRQERIWKKVVSSAQIPPQTVFGPLVAPFAEKCSDAYVYAFPSADDGQLRFFQLDSELFSNWMRYVRFAENPAEENLAVYLRGSQIVFVTVRSILPGEELKVCYSAKYAKTLGRGKAQMERQASESFGATALEFVEHKKNATSRYTPQATTETCSRIGPSNSVSDSLGTQMTENDESVLSPLPVLPSTQRPAQTFNGGESVLPPAKRRRCLANTIANAPSPLTSHASAHLKIDAHKSVSLSPSPTMSSGSAPVKAKTIREDSPEISAEKISRKNSLRSAVLEIVPPIETDQNTCDGSTETLWTERYHTAMDADIDSDWAPENDETRDGNRDLKPLEIIERIAGGQSSKSKGKRKRPKYQKQECPACHRMVFKLNKHVNQEHSEYASANYKHACETCGMRYQTMPNLRIHITTYHPGVTISGMEPTAESRQLAMEYMQKTGYYSYFCPSCNKYFLDKSLLDIHELSHRVLEDFQWRPERTCPVCAFTGASFAELALHTADHAINPKDRKQCLLCPRQVCKLSTHYAKDHPEYREIISSEWHFECQECGVKLRSQNQLDVHTRTHAKRLYKFRCLYCALQFESGIAHSKHNLTHQRDGVYPCPLCPRTFPRYKPFRTHYQRQHDVKSVLICEICQAVFRRRDRLRAHMRLHNENAPS